MSSHHFVKEGQELPLVVFNWSNRLEKVAAQLLGWQPLFVVDELFVDHVISFDLKPDVILGKSQMNRFDFLQPIDFWDGLKRDDSNQYMVLASWEKQRCIDWVLSTNDIVYTETHKYYKVNAHTFKIWMAKGAKLSVFNIKLKSLQSYFIDKEGFFQEKLGEEGFVVMLEL